MMNSEEARDVAPAATEATTDNPAVTTSAEELVKGITEAESMSDFLPLFNASIAKKQALRVLKREEILDKVTERIGERLDRRPDEITMAELNAIDKTMGEQKAKELAIVNSATDAPAITLNQNNINVTVNDGMSRESRERVIDAVRELLAKAKASAGAEKNGGE